MPPERRGGTERELGDLRGGEEGEGEVRERVGLLLLRGRPRRLCYRIEAELKYFFSPVRLLFQGIACALR